MKMLRYVDIQMTLPSLGGDQAEQIDAFIDMEEDETIVGITEHLVESGYWNHLATFARVWIATR